MIIKPFTLLLILLTLTGCASHTVRTTEAIPLDYAQSSVAETELLDVNIQVFDAGLEDLADDDPTSLPEIRNAESRFIPYRLAEVMQHTGYWGAVRVTPQPLGSSDLLVSGEILVSNGQELELTITARDATGREWFERDYRALASSYSYQKGRQRDPFLDLYHRIANDLAKAYQQLSSAERRQIRTVSNLQFAASFSPERFSGYLEEGRNGLLEPTRLPAENDPMLERIERIRERDYLFIDTVHDYYGGFIRSMQQPYNDWRRANYQEVLAYQELQRQTRLRTAAGIVAIIAGIAAAGSDDGAARQAGNVAVVGGGYLIKSAIDKHSEAQIHLQALTEIGESLSADIGPQVIQLEQRTVTLTGTVSDQYDQWRGILQQIYREEYGDL